MSLSFLHSLPPAQQEVILNGPALAPPEGVVPNLIDPPNGNTTAIAVAIVCCTISTILIIIRIYAKAVVMRQVRIEEILAIVAYGCFLGFIYLVSRFVRNTGFFVHQWNVPLRKMFEYAYLIQIGSMLWCINICCIKAAILTEWLRIFVPGKTRNAFFWCCWVVIIVNVCFYISDFVATNLLCIPYRAIWDLTIKGKCLNEKAMAVATASMNVILDGFILLLPQKIIWSLNMPAKRKLGVSVIFAAGLFASISGAFRLVYTVQYARYDDVTYDVSVVIVWTLSEMTCGFLVFCIPLAPKAFSNFSIPESIASRVRAWKSLRSSMRSASSKNKSRGDVEHGQVALSDVSNNAKSPSESMEYLKEGQNSSTNGISRTTYFVTTSRACSEGEIADQPWGRQHEFTQERP